MNTNALVDLDYMIWAFIIGISIASVYMFYIKTVQGKLVRKLIAIDACSPETAISLDKIDYKMNPLVQSALRKKSSLSETVKVTESGQYYINPLMLDKAKTKYRSDIMPVVLLLVLLLLLAGLGLMATKVLPELVNKASDITNSTI